MPNSFDYFDYRLELNDFAAVVAVVRLELLCADYRLRMDYILLIYSIWGRFGRLVEQLDPIFNENMSNNMR